VALHPLVSRAVRVHALMQAMTTLEAVGQQRLRFEEKNKIDTVLRLEVVQHPYHAGASIWTRASVGSVTLRV